MPYGKFIRPLAFVVCFSFCVSLCLGLVFPVMAADGTSQGGTFTFDDVEFPFPDSISVSGSFFIWNYKGVYYLHDCSSVNVQSIYFVDGVYPTIYVTFGGVSTILRYRYSDGTWVDDGLFRSPVGGSVPSIGIYGIQMDVVDSSAISLVEELTFESNGPVVDSVTLSASSSAPYYPGTDVQFNAQLIGTGIEPGSPESTLYWYVRGNTSEDTYFVSESDSGATLHIGNDETATTLEIEAISTYDTTKSSTLELPVTYPLEGVQIIPSGVQEFLQSDKQRTIQYQLLLPNGDPYDYQLIEWFAKPTLGHENYFTINDAGLLTIAPDAPVGSGCTIQFAYQSDTSALSPVGASVQIISQLDGVIDGITPTPEQSDKADQMEDAIGDAAGKLENNNSSLGDLTPTRPQVNTDLQLDQENLLAVSPLVTNIWSINGLGRMISIVLVVATVAYVFFGKRDG